MKIIKYISLIFIITMMQSCEDFLTYKDKDKIVPKTLNHYEELIFGELLLKDIESVLYKAEIMTDDVSDFFNQWTTDNDADQRIKLYGWYTWSKNPQIDKSGDEAIDECWGFFYNKILMCNIIEEKANEFEDQPLKFRLLGEIQFIRAMSYYYLVNFYGLPYESLEQSKTAAGIPINRETSIRKNLYTRSTLREVYDLIESDLISAISNLEKGDGKITKFRPNQDVIKLFLSRIYLYQKNYEATIRVTNELIAESTTTIETLENMKVYPRYMPLLYNLKNPGILFTWGYGGNGFLSVSDNIKYNVSEELTAMYDFEDIRWKAFFDEYGKFPTKHRSSVEPYFKKCYRIEEAYLNRAEAYAETGKVDLALADINHIRKQRIEKPDYVRETNDKAQAIDYVRTERRLELCFEDHRWFDIRRWGLEIVHHFRDRKDKTRFEAFRLKKNSPNYTLPIPLTEQRINDVIEEFPREDCKITNV